MLSEMNKTQKDKCCTFALIYKSSPKIVCVWNIGCNWGKGGNHLEANREQRGERMNSKNSDIYSVPWMKTS